MPRAAASRARRGRGREEKCLAPVMSTHCPPNILGRYGDRELREGGPDHSCCVTPRPHERETQISRAITGNDGGIAMTIGIRLLLLHIHVRGQHRAYIGLEKRGNEGRGGRWNIDPNATAAATTCCALSWHVYCLEIS